MSFLFPALATAGVAFAGVPVVIHLLSRLRRRVVPWGAMDFLLSSHRKSRFLVRLSEFALLLARVVAVALTGALVAGPRWAAPSSPLGGEGEQPTYVVVDDSPSMQESAGEQSPWIAALRVAATLVERADEQKRPLALLRQSDTVLGVRTEFDASAEPRANAAERALRDLRSRGVSDVASSGAQTLAELAKNLPPDGAATVVWLSDFRRATVDDGVRGVLGELDSAGCGVIVCPCGESVAQPNLQVASLTLAPGSHAAETVATARVEIRNAGLASSTEASVELTETGAAGVELPVPALPLGGSATLTTPVRLRRGANDLEARLSADALNADNTRYATLTAPSDRAVLLCDGSEAGDESRAFVAALAPSGVTTGWRPDAVLGGTLRERFVKEARLAPAIGLLGVPQLESPTIASLADRLRSGGGVLVVLGSGVETDDWRRLFSALGFGGLTLGPVKTTDPDRSGIEIVDHPSLSRFAGVAGPLLPLVRVGVYRSAELAEPWSVLLRTTAGDPLLVVREVGDGRLAVLLTSAAAADPRGERWSNLAALPIFPLLAGDLFAWLAHPRLRLPERTVGDPVIDLGSDLASDRASTVVGAGLGDTMRRAVPGSPSAAGGAGPAARAGIVGGRFARAGIYETTAEDRPSGRVAVNIDPAEGRLARLTTEELEARYGEVAVVTPADRFGDTLDDPRDLTLPFVAGLLLLLGGERLLSLRGLA